MDKRDQIILEFLRQHPEAANRVSAIISQYTPPPAPAPAEHKGD